MSLDSIEDHRHAFVASAVGKFLDHRQIALVHKTGAYHEYGHIDNAGDNGCVGNHLGRRAIDEYVVELRLNFIEQFCETAVEQQRGRVRRQDAYTNEIEILFNAVEAILRVLHISVEIG